MFVTFEGPEGAGKTTLIRALGEALRASGEPVVATREPGGGGPTSVSIRELLLQSETLTLEAELLLFLADRAEHVARVIRPALEQGALVLCDRYSDSTMVYQGYARGHDLAWLRELDAFASGGLRPDLTVLLDLDPEVGLARLKNPDRLDAQPLAFHRKVREGFLCEMEREPGRWVRLDATEPPSALVGQALDAIRARRI